MITFPTESLSLKFFVGLSGIFQIVLKEEKNMFYLQSLHFIHKTDTVSGSQTWVSIRITWELVDIQITPHSLHHSQFLIREPVVGAFFSLFLRILFIYFRQSEPEREREWVGELGTEREADSPQNKEPATGLDPRTLGSWPELKADS